MSDVINIEKVVEGYIMAALWADCMCACGSGDCDCESGGRTHLKVRPSDERYITQLVEQFVKEHPSDCELYILRHGDWNGQTDSMGRSHYSASECLGHDLRMTAGGHGVGFWDRGLGDLGDRLTKAVDLGTPYCRMGGGDVWEAADGYAAFDHYDLEVKV